MWAIFCPPLTLFIGINHGDLMHESTFINSILRSTGVFVMTAFNMCTIHLSLCALCSHNRKLICEVFISRSDKFENIAVVSHHQRKRGSGIIQILCIPFVKRVWKNIYWRPSFCASMHIVLQAACWLTDTLFTGFSFNITLCQFSVYVFVLCPSSHFPDILLHITHYNMTWQNMMFQEVRISCK